ncbi:MAG: Trigger factor [Rhodospirillaceae bacterium]|nr:trigger factor [Rhodospirillaceae bacterium]MBL6772825.1 trigger factor [Alphaproteobacteria bacterium]OUX70237.1 MAG: trigger factor [Rhodospirillaceae bacterium TMED140]CAI8376268.1 MAG: Trigger factor [Rhodospirillaceae bacterium]
MQINLVSEEGLSRAFDVTVPGVDFEAKVDKNLAGFAKDLKLPGFRPGKVPMTVVRSRYRASIMEEVMNETVQEAVRSALTEHEITAAAPANVTEIKPFEAGEDVAFSFAIDVMPTIELTDFSKLSFDRMVPVLEDRHIDDALNVLAERGAQPVDIENKKHKVKKDDIVILDFAGSVDGKERPGMKGENAMLQIGSGMFIPGFEEQLKGKKLGDEFDFDITFPDDYNAEELQGVEANFKIKIKELKQLDKPEIDEEFAKKFGKESIEELQLQIKQELDSIHRRSARFLLKREIMDQLMDTHEFELPTSLVDNEFNAIWQQIMNEAKAGRVDEEDKGKTEDELKGEYRQIAERRVRLGLVLSEVATSNKLDITPEEFNAAIQREMAMNPGEEAEIYQRYTTDPNARQSLIAPMMEDKAVDYILELAKVTDIDTDPDKIEELIDKPAEI